MYETRDFDTYQRGSFLFPDTGILHGIARLADYARTLDQYNVTPTDGGADTRALIQDWLAVGDDLNRAIAQTEINSLSDRSSQGLGSSN